MTKRWVCSVCGYVHEGPEPPETCPQCGVGADKFIDKGEVEASPAPASASHSEGIAWATEHLIGVAKGVDSRVLEGLRANFVGECTEVGMYLAMSRQADRQGFPEIAEAYKRIAWEEAEHAAKFAELLGEVVDTDTQVNLQKRVAAEEGACQGKQDLATLAKQLNYDAIHDSVHEMAKDEARHGAAFAGLLKRYF